ncbi:hypothetical protein BHE74_00059014, partial [Ensete ventricosum]
MDLKVRKGGSELWRIRNVTGGSTRGCPGDSLVNEVGPRRMRTPLFEGCFDGAPAVYEMGPRTKSSSITLRCFSRCTF